MITNIFKIAFRNIFKYKYYTLINVLGLAVGFTAFILVSLFVHYEFSWDKHNANYDRIYRVQRHYIKAQHAMDGNDISPHTQGITAKLLYPRYPEIEKTMILRELDGIFISSEPGKEIYDKKAGFSAEQSILEIFTYDFIAGDKNHALVDPYSIVLSESMAQKLFSGGDAMGKTVLLEKKYTMKVTGIYRDLPYNSIIRPSYIVSLSTLEKNNEDARNSMAGNYMTYVLLKPGQDYKALNAKIWDLYKGFKNFEDVKIKLCPLSRLYLSFNGQTAYLIILSLYRLVGIFILVLAAFNYINLTTANTSVRAKEIGIRKVHGSSRWSLSAQFLGETLILAIIAVNLAFFLTELLLPVFNNLVQKELSLSYATNWPFILKTAAMSVITGLVAGIYPAFFMSSQNVILLFKGNIFRAKKQHFSVKKFLVSGQFSISIFLIIITLAFTVQIKYLLNKDLGLNQENVLYTTLNITRPETRFDEFRSRMLQHPEILNCAIANHAPFVSHGGGTINWEGCEPGDILEIRNKTVSYDFVKTFHIQIVEGRDFSRDFPADHGKACLINETAKKCFDYQNPLGKRIDNGRLEIVGVLKDFHYKDMYNTIEPAVIELAPDTIRGGRWTIVYKVQAGKMAEARAIIQSEVEAYFPTDPFEVNVLFDAFRTENVFKILDSVNNSLLFFTIINVLLAAMGLLGLVAFTTQRRTKEIGVRKIMGSSVSGIFYMLTKEYMLLVIVASVISWPCGYIAFTYLPGNYKTPMPYYLFILSTCLIIVISILTSLYHTLKAAYTNPVDALRYE